MPQVKEHSEVIIRIPHVNNTHHPVYITEWSPMYALHNDHPIYITQWSPNIHYIMITLYTFCVTAGTSLKNLYSDKTSWLIWSKNTPKDHNEHSEIFWGNLEGNICVVLLIQVKEHVNLSPWFKLKLLLKIVFLNVFIWNKVTLYGQQIDLSVNL